MIGSQQFDEPVLPLPDYVVPIDQRKHANEGFNQLVHLCERNRRSTWLCFASYAYVRRIRLVEALRVVNGIVVTDVSVKTFVNGKRGLVIQYANVYKRGYITLWFHDIDLDAYHREKGPSERRSEIERIAFLDRSDISKVDWFASPPDSRLAHRVKMLARHFGYEHVGPYLSLDQDRRTKSWLFVGTSHEDPVIPIAIAHNARTLLEALEIGEKHAGRVWRVEP